MSLPDWILQMWPEISVLPVVLAGQTFGWSIVGVYANAKAGGAKNISEAIGFYSQLCRTKTGYIGAFLGKHTISISAISLSLPFLLSLIRGANINSGLKLLAAGFVALFIIMALMQIALVFAVCRRTSRDVENER